MIHEILAVGPLQCNCSILGDEVSKEAIVVDPGSDIPRILQILKHHELTVSQIVVTHAHIDHIAGALELKRLTRAPILYNQLDLPLVAIMGVQAGWLGVATPEVAEPDDSPKDGDVIAAGGPAATVILTPGHTEGSFCLHLPEQELLIAGDTLFAGSVGRTDLPGGNTRQLLDSIRDRLLPLPDATKVIPRPRRLHHHRTRTQGQSIPSRPLASFTCGASFEVNLEPDLQMFTGLIQLHYRWCSCSKDGASRAIPCSKAVVGVSRLTTINRRSVMP